MLRALRHSLLLIGTLLLLPAAGAQANVIQDCSQDDVLDRSYSRGELQSALNNIPGDVDEYTLCRAAINKALTGGPKATKSQSDGSGGAGGGTGGGASGKSGNGGSKGKSKDGKSGGQATGDPSQLASVDDVLDSTGPGVQATATASDGMPLPALLALIALTCVAIGGGLYVAAKRNPAFAETLRRVPLPWRRS